MKIVSASISRKEMGKFEIEQKFTLDATEEFNEHIKGWDKEDPMYEEEVMSAFGDYDYIDIDKDELYDQLNSALLKYSGVEFYVDNVYISVSSPVGYPSQTTTMKEITEALKKIEITVEANLSYEIPNHEDVEAELAKIVIAGNPDKVKRVSEAKTTAGAHDISFELEGEATRKQIEEAFKRQQESDANSGDDDEDGYDGDFRTVNRVDFKHLGKVFEDGDEAYQFALDKAEKWETVVAVYYKTKDGKVKTLVAGWGAS